MGTRWTLFAALCVLCAGITAEERALSKEAYLDKCRGAWAGQMAGVCFGAPYEFRSNGEPITDELRSWKPKYIRGAIKQDDCYVEMTFLAALLEQGLDITYEQAGRAFADTEYPLWHANRAGRENIRHGIMPPLSGHPSYNRHADDIDFQIEADLFGILCPGLPGESNRLCEVFGHIMNYGDGVYGGMFVAGMYAAAFFETGEHPRPVVEAGLACIPPESQYAACIRDVLRWHDAHPGDWLAVWRMVEDKWQDDIDCSRGNPFNIDAKLNGAYIAIALLYGAGDMQRTLEVGTRCGQDADCNPSNAAGVLGCMRGFDALDPQWTEGIEDIKDEKFSHTGYAFDDLVAHCADVAGDVVRRAGGRVEDAVYHVPVQAPHPPATTEQWVHQLAILDTPILKHEVAWWDARWRIVACGSDMDPGVQAEHHRKENVLCLHPVSESEPAAIEAELEVPRARCVLSIEAASHEKGDFVLKVFADGKLAAEEEVDTRGKWRTVEVDLDRHAGHMVPIRIEAAANGWQCEAGYLGEVTFEKR